MYQCYKNTCNSGADDKATLCGRPFYESHGVHLLCALHWRQERSLNFFNNIVRPDFKNTGDKPEAPWSPEAPGSATHEVPLALGPLHIEGKQQERKGGGLGNLCIFPLLFLSHSLLPALLILSSFSCFPSLFFLSFCLFAHITFFHIYTRLPAVLFASPRSLCCCCPPLPPRPVPPCLRSFDQACMSPSLPPSELCLLTISYFPSASSPSSCSFATKMAAFHDPLGVTWLSSRS